MAWIYIIFISIFYTKYVKRNADVPFDCVLVDLRHVFAYKSDCNFFVKANRFEISSFALGYIYEKETRCRWCVYVATMSLFVVVKLLHVSNQTRLCNIDGYFFLKVNKSRIEHLTKSIYFFKLFHLDHSLPHK